MRWIHATSAKRAEGIRRTALREGTWVIPEERGYGEIAKYAKLAASKDQSSPVILVLEIPDDATALETLGSVVARIFGPAKNHRTIRPVSGSIVHVLPLDDA